MEARTLHAGGGRPSRTGKRDVVEIADTAMVARAVIGDAVGTRVPVASPGSRGLPPLAAIAAEPWRALAGRAIEPNGYYLPDWEIAVNTSARERIGASALCAWDNATPAQLTRLMPVISMWRAYKIPLPALVSADPYGSLCTPLLDRDMAEEAVTGILQQSRRAGAHALIFRAASLEGAAMKAFTDVLHRSRLQPVVLQS